MIRHARARRLETFSSRAQPHVRNLDEEVVQTLKQRSARHGRSAGTEHREILREALLIKPAEDPKAVLLEMPPVGEDADFERIRSLPRFDTDTVVLDKGADALVVQPYDGAGWDWFFQDAFCVLPRDFDTGEEPPPQERKPP